MSKTVLITGASRGIGKTAAKLFHEKGWQVSAAMRNPSDAGELADLDQVFCPTMDVSDPQSIQTAIEQTLDRFKIVDVLVNNAGYAAFGPFEASRPEQVRRQFDVNVFGLMEVTRCLLPHFRSRKQGTIVNISSIAGKTAFPWYSLYNSTKWAVEGFTEALQHEVRPFGIRLKLIEPGIIRTDFYNDSMDRMLPDHGMDYQARFNHSLKKFLAMEKTGSHPDVVAKKIYQAATDQSWRLRYPVGGNAPFILLARKFLPDSVITWLIRQSTGMESGHEKPRSS